MCPVSLLIVVLVLSVVTDHVHSTCDFTSDHDNVIYLSVMNDSLPAPGYHLTQPPSHLHDINRPCFNDLLFVPCCASSTGSEEYLFLSLDDALGLTEDGYFNSSEGSGRFLLAVIGGTQSDNRISVRLSHTLKDMVSFTLQSFNNTDIHCEDNVTLYLDSICSVSIRDVTLFNCGSVTEAAVKLDNMRFINIESVSINSSASGGIAISFLTELPSSVHQTCILDFPDFTPQISILNSNFVSNGAKLEPSNSSSINNVNGGGLNIEFYTSIWDQSVQVNVTNTIFLNNTAATTGGGLSYTAYDASSVLTVSDCQFIGNTALIHAGAAYLSGTNIHFLNTTFTDNSALYTGGAIYHFVKTDDSFPSGNGLQIEYRNCIFSRNRAQGGVLELISHSVIASPIIVLGESIDITNTTFEDSEIDFKLLFGGNPCTIYSDNLNLNIRDSVFKNNKATAVCIRSAIILLSGNVVFEFNRGNQGGALSAVRAQLNIAPGANVLFNRNRAINGGGVFENGQLIIDSEECLFQFPAGGEPYNITFTGNTAIGSGSSIYFYEPTEACLDDVQRLGLPTDEYSSKLSTITFHEPILVNNDDGSYYIDLVLGQLLLFNVTVLDYFNTTSFAQVNVILEKNAERNRSLHFGYQTAYNIRGFPHMNLENGINKQNISIYGPEITNTETSKYKLNIIGDLERFASILVNLKPCPLGFVYNDIYQQCMCAESDSIACDYTSAVSCIFKGFWIGNSSNGGHPPIAPCTSLYCQNNVGVCEDCPIVNQAGYCRLPETSSQQCLSNRDGVLCSECVEYHALTFGGIKCVPDSTCNKGMGLIPAALNIVFLIFTITILIIMLKFGYKLSTGYLYSFIFYFSVIRHLLNPVDVGDGVLLYISIPASFTQLNPQFLGYIPICFAKALTPLQQQVFLYLNPLIISAFVLLVVGISRRFSKIQFADNTMVKAICLLVLLSFTALTETSFNIINPVKFAEISGLVVNFQPSTKYLDVTQHLPYFIIAVLVFLVLVIPFTLLLLFAPLLTKCFNMNKIKPFLDEFQGCYKDRFRWMAGYYFLARFVYILILTSPSYKPVITQYVIQLLAFIFLVIHMLIQPYTDNWLNFVDSLLLADIVLMTLLFGSTAQIVFASAPDLRIAIVVILVLIPILYLVTLITLTIVSKFNLGRKIKERFMKEDSDKDRRGSFWISITRRKTGSSSNDLREPLLDMLSAEDDDTFRPPSATISTFRPRFKSKEQSGVSHSVVSSYDHEADQPALPLLKSPTINEV